jgi:peptidoglycan/xylan/chitin deacetylase (PgdA/CDA1 family)
MPQGKLSWPQGKRVAVVVSVLLETWSDGKSPSYFPRTTPLAAGEKDIAGINWSRFGGNEGIWRLSRILGETGVRGTLFCNGRSAELWPDAVAAFVRAGHGIAGHGYLQDQTLFSMSAEVERETIKKTLDILEKVSGSRPIGWTTPIYGFSENTLDYLVEAKVAWASDGLDSSIPHRQKTKNGSILIFPWSDFVDNRVLRTNPENYFDVYKNTFEYLNASEPGAFLNVGVHAHFGGRPLMSAIFKKTLEYLKGQKDIWFAQHHEVVQWLADQKADDVSYRSQFFGAP